MKDFNINYPVYILGPCVYENDELVWLCAEKLAEISKRININFIFKVSFDKANRTSIKSYRGVTLKHAKKNLLEIKKKFNVPIVTDVHLPSQIDEVSEFADMIQIPAFLCRQTDIIVESAKSGKVINVKKGQFLAPWDVENIAKKLIDSGCNNFCFTERGTSFGYGNLVADMRSLYWIRKLGYKVIFDATHSVQKPGALGETTGGDRELAPVLARSAVAAGCDGVFIETHPNPDKALSDGPNQIPLDKIESLLINLQKIYNVTN